MERFTRPSCLAMLNTNIIREDWLEDRLIPARLNDTPERTIINFFSCLRELNEKEKSKFIAYAYGFLAPSLQRKISLEEIEDRLNGICGVHLIKIIRLAKDRNQLFATRFFIELEILKGNKV
jgi:nanoRNase/pAp phosphatase (c-di-AMP/oligoRNAs hydrolase)